MCQILCVAAFLLAQLWTASSANFQATDELANRIRDRIQESGEWRGPPVFSRIPYLNRLFREVGYTREVIGIGSGARIGIDFGDLPHSAPNVGVQGTITPELNIPIRNSTFNFATPQFGGYQPQPPGTSVGVMIGGVCGASPKAEHRVLACWDGRVHLCDDAANPGRKFPALKGSVYVFATDTGKTVDAKGCFIVELCDAQARKLAEWTLDADSLELLKRKDLIGVGYSLCLPLDVRSIAAQDVKVTLSYHTWRGKACSAEPTGLTLQAERTPVVQAQQVKRTVIPSIALRHGVSKQMTLTQVIALSRRGIADDIILRQMEATASVFNLSVEDILHLHDEGASNAVIRAMQDRRPARSEQDGRLELDPIRAR